MQRMRNKHIQCHPCHCALQLRAASIVKMTPLPSDVRASIAALCFDPPSQFGIDRINLLPGRLIKNRCRAIIEQIVCANCGKVAVI